MDYCSQFRHKLVQLTFQKELFTGKPICILGLKNDKLAMTITFYKSKLIEFHYFNGEKLYKQRSTLK